MEFENIYLRIHPKTERLSTEYRYEDEYMQFSRKIKLDIFGKLKNHDVTYGELQELYLGFLEGTFLHMNRMSRELGEDDIWVVFDHFGGGIEELGNVIFESEQNYSNIVGRNHNIFLIDAIYIHSAYQGKGVGKRVISELEASLLWLFDYTIGSFIANPTLYAQQLGNDMSIPHTGVFSQTVSKQAVRFFKHLGFKQIVERTNYLYLNTDFEMINEEAYEETYDFKY